MMMMKIPQETRNIFAESTQVHGRTWMDHIQ